MKKESVEKHLAEYKGSESSYPFGPEALVYKVMGKMFALVSQTEEVARVTLKVNPEDGAMLVGQYDSVVPGYYMNKKHWNSITFDNTLPEGLILSMIDDSYDLVVKSLKKVERETLLAEAEA